MSSQPLKRLPGTLVLGPVARRRPAPVALYEETLRLAEARAATVPLQVVDRIVDAQTHQIKGRPELGNPLLGDGDIFRATSGLGGTPNADTMALARHDPSIIPMLSYRLEDFENDARDLRTQLQDWEGPFGVGELEWAHPYADVSRYSRFFDLIAEVAKGRKVVVDLHTGIISSRVVDEIVPHYSEWLRNQYGLSWRKEGADGEVHELNSGLAHDPTHLVPLFERFAQTHPNITFVLSHPVNPVGPEHANPAVALALRLPNVLLGTAAVMPEKLQLFDLAKRDPKLWDRIVFQSDGGGGTAAQWLEAKLLELTRDPDVVDRVFFRNAAKAFGLGTE